MRTHVQPITPKRIITGQQQPPSVSGNIVEYTDGNYDLVKKGRIVDLDITTCFASHGDHEGAEKFLATRVTGTVKGWTYVRWDSHRTGWVRNENIQDEPLFRRTRKRVECPIHRMNWIYTNVKEDPCEAIKNIEEIDKEKNLLSFGVQATNRTSRGQCSSLNCSTPAHLSTKDGLHCAFHGEKRMCLVCNKSIACYWGQLCGRCRDHPKHK